MFERITAYYPRIPVTFVLNKSLQLKGLKEPSLNLVFMVVADLAHGETWSKLLRKVTTP